MGGAGNQHHLTLQPIADAAHTRYSHLDEALQVFL